MDAVVAHAYCLGHAQYERILASFSHKSFPEASALCLAAFGELACKGLVQYCRDHDPYWDTPLVASRAPPVIRLPDTGTTQGSLVPTATGPARA